MSFLDTCFHSIGPVVKSSDGEDEEDLLSSTDISLEKRKALTRFQRLRQTPNMCSPEEALADIYLTSLTGSGGFASVYSGLWYGSGHVAVKICCTRPKQDGQFPARVFTEAIICKGLAHPSVIQTFEVRCCRVSPSFLARVYAHPSPSPQPLPEAQGDAAAAGFASLHTAATLTSHVASGLFSCPPVQPGSKSNSVQSVDEFGALVDTQSLPPVSWAEILDVVQAEAGQVLTILIMHRAKLGNLWQAIQRNLFEPRPELPAVDRRKRTRALLRTACEIAGGLEYLHMNDIIHADLKPGNVLLNDSRGDARGFCAAVSDFGLSTLLDPKASDCQSEGGGAGTLPYMSPEVLALKHVSKASDVYAYGILLLEMAQSGPAYSKACLADLALRVMIENLRPEWPAHVCPELGKLYQQCVARDPLARPSASTIVTTLCRLERQAQVSGHEERAALRKATAGMALPAASPAAPPAAAAAYTVAGAAGAQ
ncbi:kinase-like domain-containing protein [Haematococcus lacustris]